jgi:hypothetical protein
VSVPWHLPESRNSYSPKHIMLNDLTDKGSKPRRHTDHRITTATPRRAHVHITTGTASEAPGPFQYSDGPSAHFFFLPWEALVPTEKPLAWTLASSCIARKDLSQPTPSAVSSVRRT